MLDFPSWFSGFVDGEGYFAIGKQLTNGKYPSYKCAFGIELRDDDADILHEIRDYFNGIGGIHHRPERKRLDRNYKPSIVWRVSSIDDIMILVRHFDEYPLRAKKRIDYNIWRLAVMELRKTKHLRDYHFLGVLKKKMHLCKQYDGNPLEVPFPKPIPQLTLFSEGP